MKKVIVTLLLLALSSAAFSWLRLSVSPGLEPYGDALGYSIGASLMTDLRSFARGVDPGFFTGLDISYANAAYSNLTFYNFNGGLAAGYRLSVAKNVFRVSPALTLGCGYYSFADHATNVGRAGFLVKPSVQAEFMVLPDLSLSLEAAVRFVFMPLLAQIYSPTAYVFSLTLSYYIQPDGE